MEESADPAPPDIRPFGRHSSVTTNQSHAGDVGSSPLDVRVSLSPDTSGITPARKRNTQSNISHTYYLGLVIAVLAVLPIASAASSPIQNDLFTSYPDPYTSYPPVRSRPTPLLSLLAKVLRWTVAQVHHVTRLDISPPWESVYGNDSSHGLLKRLDKTGKIEAGMIPVLVALSGMFAGLTLGYFSVDQTQLQVLSISGTLKQQMHARKIIPIRKDSHLLLTTLILGNMIVNEALPVVADGVIGGGIVSVVMSTALVVIFAEIIPQSVCSRYGLLIGAAMAFSVRCMMIAAFPIAWPIAKLLEYILGAHHGIIYRRSELRELIKMHAAGGAGGGDLDFDTIQMAQGALDLAQKTVKEAMTPIDRVFMLPIEAKLDYETLGHVVHSGHSRVPVYQMVEVPDVDLSGPKSGPIRSKMVKKVIGSLLVKSCVLLDPEDATPLATVPINAIPSVPWDEPLTNMLNVFQDGRSHMAIVSRRGRRVEDNEDAETVMTEAASGLRQRFMRKVAEISHGGKTSGSDTESSSEEGTAVERGERAEKKKRKKRQGSSSTTSPASPSSPAAQATQAEQIKQDTEADNKKCSLAYAAKLTQLEQTVPADAQLPPGMVEKFFEGLEGAPLGIITLEDVLEELIGEEIYDEYDEHDGPRNAASAFVPREAALAARKAAMDREKATAQATPLPLTDDTDLEKAPAHHAPARRIMPNLPKLPLHNFTLGRRPTSQPGRSRDIAPIVEKEVGAPIVEKANPLEGLPVVAEPARMDVSHAEETNMTGNRAIPRNVSVDRAASRGNSGDKLAAGRLSAPPPEGVGASSLGTEPESAVPARLLPGGTATTTAVPPSSNAHLLSEALLMERGRRRLAATGHPVPAAPIMLRAPSAPGATCLAVPSRPPSPTPPTVPGPAASKSTGLQPALPAGGTILSPIPMKRGKGMTFKSIPTPMGTPAPGTGENPMEMARLDQSVRFNE